MESEILTIKMREITIDLDDVLVKGGYIGYEIAEKLNEAEIKTYKHILGLTPYDVKKALKSKKDQRFEMFEAILRVYPVATKREDGTSEYLRSNLATCLSIWKKITKGDLKKEYLVLERLNEYIKKTNPKYLKRLSNWLKDVVLEVQDDSKIFSQSDIKVL